MNEQRLQPRAVRHERKELFTKRMEKLQELLDTIHDGEILQWMLSDWNRPDEWDIGGEE